jgi:hypothetical protein
MLHSKGLQSAYKNENIIGRLGIQYLLSKRAH